MWKFHVGYESRPHSVIITLGGKLYTVPKVVLIVSISFILEKQCQKAIFETRKFVLFMLQSKFGQKGTATATASTQGLFKQ